MPSFTKSGATRSSTRDAVLGDEAPQRGRTAQPAHAVFGEGHVAMVVAEPDAARPLAQRREHRVDEAVDGVRIGFGADVRVRDRAAVCEVTGPIETTAGSSAIGPTASQKLVTVDDDVNVIASTSPARTRARSSASGATGTVRYTASTSTA